MSFDPVMPPYNASDPTARFLSASCLDFLLIELVPMAHRITRQLEGRAKQEEERWLASLHNNPSQPDGGDGAGTGTDTAAAAANGEGLVNGPSSSSAEQEVEVDITTPLDDEEEREAVFWRLESIGYRVGQGLAERFSKDRPRFSDTLDIIKFLCKDLWTLVFRKQVDNLKTNHRVCGLPLSSVLFFLSFFTSVGV